MEYDRFRVLGKDIVKDINFLVDNETYMIARADGVLFTKRLLSRKVIILGIEGFFFDGENITPDMQCIFDFSNARDDSDVLRGAEIAATTNSHFLEFTFK